MPPRILAFLTHIDQDKTFSAVQLVFDLRNIGLADPCFCIIDEFEKARAVFHDSLNYAVIRPVRSAQRVTRKPSSASIISPSQPAFRMRSTTSARGSCGYM